MNSSLTLPMTTGVKLIIILSVVACLKSCSSNAALTGGAGKTGASPGASSTPGAEGPRSGTSSDSAQRGANEKEPGGLNQGNNGKGPGAISKNSDIGVEGEDGSQLDGLPGSGGAPGGQNPVNDMLIKNDPQFKNLNTEQFVVDAKTTKKPLDLIIALDTSGSMGEEAVKVQQNLTVLTQLFSKEVGLDYHIWVMAGRTTLPGSDPLKVTSLNQSIGSNDALNHFTNFLNGGIPTTVPIRANTQKAFIVITDDNAEDVTAQSFIATLQADPRFKDKTSFNGLVWLDGVSKESPTCTQAAPGVVYAEIAKAKETLGAVYDLCADNWNPLFVDLGKRLVQQTVTLEYKLKQKADPAGGFAVGVNGSKIDPASFKYDESLNAIVFTEGKAPAVGSNVVVGYKPLSI